MIYFFLLEIQPDESSVLSHKNHSRSYSIFKHYPRWSFHMFDGHKEKNGMMEEAERIEKNKNENQGLTGGQQEQVDNEKNGADLAAAAGHRATRATR